MMGNIRLDEYDYGVCEFCGQPIDIMGEKLLRILHKDEYETRVVHEECWVSHLEEEEEEEEE